MEAVTLRNGARVASPTVIVTMMDLRYLYVDAFPVFTDLVLLCRDPNHEADPRSIETLGKLGLVLDGVIHDDTRAVVLSAAQGEAPMLTLVEPTEG